MGDEIGPGAIADYAGSGGYEEGYQIAQGPGAQSWDFGTWGQDMPGSAAGSDTAGEYDQTSDMSMGGAEQVAFVGSGGVPDAEAEYV